MIMNNYEGARCDDYCMIEEHNTLHIWRIKNTQIPSLLSGIVHTPSPNAAKT